MPCVPPSPSSPQPIKVCVLGPPAVGKTTVVAQLCKHYKLHHIKMADVIKETLDRFVSARTHTHHTHAVQFFVHVLTIQERLAARVDVTDDDEESDERAQQAQEYLDLLREDRDNEENSGTRTCCCWLCVLCVCTNHSTCMIPSYQWFVQVDTVMSIY